MHSGVMPIQNMHYMW